MSLLMLLCSFVVHIVSGDMSCESRFFTSSTQCNFLAVSLGGVSIGRPMTPLSTIEAFEMVSKTSPNHPSGPFQVHHHSLILIHDHFVYMGVDGKLLVTFQNAPKSETSIGGKSLEKQ